MSSKNSGSIIYNEYFGHTETYQTKYGANTIVLMQVGSFIEVYGLKDDPTGANLETYAEICGLNIAEKSHQFRGKAVLMCGFRDYCLDSYLDILMNAAKAYTVVLFMQDESDSDKKTRSLSAIYSPGTYVNASTAITSAPVSNYILCVWIESFKVKKSAQLMFGMAVCNILSGKTHFYEYQTNNIFTDGRPPQEYTTALDTLEQFAKAFNPNEILAVGYDQDVLEWIVKRIGATTENVRYISSTGDAAAKNCQKQQYMDYMLGVFFGEDTFQLCPEFIRHAIATQALVYLLHYIQEHNAVFAKTLELPVMTNLSDTLVLANHSLEQLHIIGNTTHGGEKTVLSHINKCRTAMGARQLRYQLLHPSMNTRFLEREYNAVAEMLSDISRMMAVREHLSGVADIEKIAQQIVLGKLQPNGVGHLFRGAEAAVYSVDELHKSTFLLEYIGAEGAVGDIQKLLEFIKDKFNVEQCRGTTAEHSIFRRGAFPVLDALLDEHTAKYDEWCGVRQTLNRLIWKADGENNGSIEYVKEHRTNIHGYTLQITPTRSALFQKVPKEQLPLQLKQIKVQKKTGANNYELSCDYLVELNAAIMDALDRIQKCVSGVYREVVGVLATQQWLGVIKNLAGILCSIDFLQCRAYVAHNYRYCRPEIVAADVGSVDARQLRHCLIEQLNQKEVYVANDVSIGKDDGKSILLYGTNMVGKTSLIRALGIAVILAQAGMFVPCTFFRYSPYSAIYTRILGNDNLHAGLSTLAAEMVELREILQYADARSLVLGDEVCKGTESESALSIFAAALIHLSEKKVSYIFATHFHAILDFEEIRGLRDLLRVCHMSVHYDAELDCLIYDRLLKDGGGARTYGLEVCKSLHLPRVFMDTAYRLRNRYFSGGGELSNPITAYNARKIRGKCELCGEARGEEIHHLQQQKYADDDGFIGAIHKNHCGNLASVCEKCHTKLHTESKQIVRKKTTDGFKLIVDT